MFHFVMQGNGLLSLPDGRTYPMERFFLAVVPHDDKRTLECGTDVQSERRSSPRQLATVPFA